MDRLSEQGTGHPGRDENKVGEDIMKIGLIDVNGHNFPNIALIRKVQKI